MEPAEYTQSSPLQQAVHLREAGQYTEALRIIEHHIQSGPVTVEALALHGQLLILLNALPQAMATIEQALTLAPGHAALLRNLARGQLRQGQTAAALTNAQAAFQASQGGLEDAAVLASALGANGRPTEALGLIDQVLQHAPDYAEASATRAMLRLQVGDVAGAYVDAGVALQRKPFLAALWPVYARLALQLGDKAQARLALQHCLALEPDNLDYLVNLGELHRDAGDHDQAIALLSHACERAPDHPAILRNLGVALQEAGRLDEAEMHYRAALAAQPDNPDVRSFLASLLRQSYRYQEACQLFAQLAAERPGDAMAQVNYGVLQNDCKQYAGAVVSLHAALALDPTLAEAYGALANALRELGQLAQARQVAAQAVELKPQQASLHHTLANLLKESGDAVGAVAHYQQALALEPASYPGLGSAVTLAILAYLEGDHVRAAHLLQQADALADKRDGPFGPSRVYWIYLNALLDFYSQSTPPNVQPDGWLEVFGESHSLSIHGAVVPVRGQWRQARSHWIEGCKLWHLGRPQDNKYQQQFRHGMATLSAGSEVLVCIGEIDCRWDAPLMQRMQDVGQCEALALAVIAPALDFIAAQAANGAHRLIISGVPATQAALPVDAKVQTHFLAMLRGFNACLRQESLVRGMGFLDVFCLTDAGDGRANGRWHIDRHHLRPDGWYEAFVGGYLRASAVNNRSQPKN